MAFGRWFVVVTALWLSLQVGEASGVAAGGAQQPAAAPAAPAGSLDFEFFRTKVEPILLGTRQGHARCYSCHSEGAGGMRLQLLAPGSATWTEQQSRLNFEALGQRVVPGEPLVSRLLLHPLAEEAGGDRFHSGGKHWTSENDPEWQTLAAWVRTGSVVTPPAARALDFETYRTRVEPVFLKERVGQGSGRACVTCHSTLPTRLRLQALTPGAAAWSEDQSRSNFNLVVQLVVPGDPPASRLLLHPLAPEAGGDPTHAGGKFWASQNDPEWQAVAAWVRSGTPVAGAAAAPAAGPALDFEYFRIKVQPIFLAERPGHARCYSCHGEGAGGMRMQPLPPGRATWNDEDSRKNFEVVRQRVVPGNPLASRLLVHSLAAEAGGDPFHSGGKHFNSQNDPDWQTMADWVQGKRCVNGGGFGFANVQCPQADAR